MSLSALARDSGIDVGVLHRIEGGQIVRPAPDKLARLADVLELPLADLFAAAGYAAPTQLPSFRPYLRAKYGELPPEALAELEGYFADVQRQYGSSREGPGEGEDEAPE